MNTKCMADIISAGAGQNSIVLRSGMDMAESHAPCRRYNKRAEIAGMIARARSPAHFALIWSIWTLPFVYLLLGLEPETIPPKRIHQSDLWFEPGGLSRRVLDAASAAGALLHPRTRPRQGRDERIPG